MTTQEDTQTMTDDQLEASLVFIDKVARVFHAAYVDQKESERRDISKSVVWADLSDDEKWSVKAALAETLQYIDGLPDDELPPAAEAGTDAKPPVRRP